MRRAATCLLLVAALVGCRTPAPASDEIQAELRPLSTDEQQSARLGAVEVLSIHQLTSGRQWFGGISGLSYDGHTVTAINDVGHWLRFRMKVDDSGRPVAFDKLEVESLGGLDGSKEDGDAEELTAMPDGWLVSFERRHRILFYRHGLSGTPERIDLPQGFTRQPDNGGVEALVRLADGRLLMLSEEGGSDDLGWGWIGEPGAWKRLSYRRTGLFRPTSAAVLPNGDVLVLERSFTLVGGVASRLVRLKAADLRPGAVLEGTELFALRPPLLVDNYEGLTVQKRRDGRLVAYILSDDNFNPLQATLLMAILLPD